MTTAHPPWDLSTRDGYRHMLESGGNPNSDIVEEILDTYFPNGATTRERPGTPPQPPAPQHQTRPAPQTDALFDLA